MAPRVTSRGIQEIVTKLSSDKAKNREEGIKLLSSWLEGEKSVGFCRYLCEKSSGINPTEIPHSETWSFLVKILIQCIKLEISSSKKRLPKLTFAKTLRVVVQRAEDDKFSGVYIHGKRLLLLPVVRLLYSHVGDIIQDVPSYQSEYGVILRHLLSNKDYRFHMRKKVYSNLVLLYMQKVENSLSAESFCQLNPKEEVFRFTLTLQSLLENPPGDILDSIREDIVHGFVRIFSHIRDEGKISRKLIECINTYLSKDGPNLGFKSIEIHEAVQQFVFRCWFTTHDRCLKDVLIFYARLQLSLTRGMVDGTDFLEQLLDVIIRELDQMSTSCANIQRVDSVRDEKYVLLTSSQRGAMELAAFVICRACSCAPKASNSGKRSRREHIKVVIKERLMEGKWPWTAAILLLIRNYSTRVKKDLFVYWFHGIAANFERIINSANMDRSYDGLLWTLWCLLRFSSLLPATSFGCQSTMNYTFRKIEVEQGWHTIWSSLIHALPSFVNIPSIVDASLMLLCNIMLNDSNDSFFTSPEILNLRVFKSLPSISTLCFISCYFSRRASQADSRDASHLRQEVLQAVLSLLNPKECQSLNERLVVMLPEAAYSLCTGSAPLIEALGVSSSIYSEGLDDKEGDLLFEGCEIFEFSVEVLAKIDHDSARQVYSLENRQRLRLPRQLRVQLLHEMETYILECIRDKKTEKMLLSEVINFCAFLSNIMYCSYSTRIKEDIPPFFSKLGEFVSEFLEHAITVIEKTYNGIVCGDLGSESFLSNLGLNIASFSNFSHSPLFTKWLKKDAAAAKLLSGMIRSSERLLKSLGKLYESFSLSRKIVSLKPSILDSLDIPTVEDSLSTSKNSLILDMELDMNSGPSEIDSLTIDGEQSTAISNTMVNHKLDLLSIMSTFFSIIPTITWKTFFDIKDKESDPKISERILCSLCQNPHWSSCKELLELVTYLSDSFTLEENLKIHCTHVLGGINSLASWLLNSDGDLKHESESSSGEKVPDKCLIALGDLVNKVSNSGFLDWHDRSKLIECISNFIILSPPVAQSMIEKLFMLLRDPDYRVRFHLACRIGVLFQTWDGHMELFQDICSNFGTKLVTFPSEKVTREEVLADGSQPNPVMETTVITLMHIVLQSDKIELQAAFMICVVAATNFNLRELVGALLDSLAVERGYQNRAKYMEQLMGPLLFAWIECRVSLAALVETRDLYVSRMEPSNFVQYCCQWLLPALILHDDSSNLQWIAKVSNKPSEDLVKDHFVHIFSVCMALHCSKKDGWDRGSWVLGSSLLSIGKISEQERDELIKKRMVSIVNCTLSLASSASDPRLPLFSKDTIAYAIRTVVDGFLDNEDHSTTINLLDKIHIFRPDRVFMFIVDMHYKVNAASFCWHRRNHLAGIEVLVNLLGDRASMPSTSCYLLNIVGQFIDNYVLMEQCCSIISTLLKLPRSAESTRLLGEQLQYLVGKLVKCSSPSETCGKLSASTAPQAITLLKELTIGSDSSMHEYIKELEPFPQHNIFDDIRRFHQKVSEDYSARSHLFNFVKRSQLLPPRLLRRSLKALHENVFARRKHLGEVYDENVLQDVYWNSDNEIVYAAWNLVHICSINNESDLGALVADFISMVGIGDPHRVVLHFPGEPHTGIYGMAKSLNVADPVIHLDTGMPNEILLMLMRLLKKYLMDDSVELIDKASQALRGIISTEKGQQSLLQLDSYERSLVEVHSKGVNFELVQNLIANLQQRSDREISLEDSSLWSTSGKMFEEWICPLVYAMISYCDDPIIRFCQHIVLAKSEVAELLFSSLIVNIAGRHDLTVDLRKIISSKVQEYVFSESNTLVKSKQLFLNALNDLRWRHVMERTKSSAPPQKQKISKQAKLPVSGSKLRAMPVKMKNLETASSGLITSPLLWGKVYWLVVDYLIVAKSAIDCGSYFTAFLYVEHWCEDNFNGLTLGAPDFSIRESLPRHIEILLSAVTQINEPDSLYGVIQSHKLTSQILTFEHEGDWSKALEFYDMKVRSEQHVQIDGREMINKKSLKGLIRSLQQTGCSHVLDLYCQGLTAHSSRLQYDFEFSELQYEAAWRCGNWDFCPLYSGADPKVPYKFINGLHFNENLHGCLRALHEGEFDEFHRTLKDSKKVLLTSIYQSSKESTQYIFSAMVKLQILHHLGMAWSLRWNLSSENFSSSEGQKLLSESTVPRIEELQRLRINWNSILKTELHMNLLEPFIAFRRVLLQILNSGNSTLQHLLESASILRKGSRISQSAAALHEFKFLCSGTGEDFSNLYWLGRLEEAKLLRAQSQHQMAVHLADHICKNHHKEDTPDVYRLVGKWLAEARASNSRTILEKYLKHAVNLANLHKDTDKSSLEQRNKMHFHLAHYADALFRSHEERISSSEWQVAMRLRKHKTRELEALIKRFKSMAKGDKTDYSLKIQELQKQLTMDREEEDKLQEDRDNFLQTALEGYTQCLVIGEKYDVRAVFRLVSLWFSLSARQIVVDSMLCTIKEVQSYKFIPLVYQIASRMGGTKDSSSPSSFQFALRSLLKKMSTDHPYHTIFQLLALAYGDRIKDKQRSRNSFVVDIEKKEAAEDLLRELSSHHGSTIRQMKQMVEIYIKLAEMETKREDTNKRVTLPRDVRSVRNLELVPVVTSNFSVDRTCQYPEGSFPYFRGLADSVTIMNGINAPKVVECLGSDGTRYRQLAKSGNDDLRQDAVMEQFFGLVNTFLQNNRITRQRKLRIRTYKVVPFTPSAGVLEWVNGTLPLGEYLIGSSRNGGAHGCYGVGDWTFMECRQHMTAEANKRKAFQEVCDNFRPVMHNFFLERFSHPADWFEKRLAYTRGVAASSMVGYIVGLGDRHSMNILIDQVSAEVVHIDLGVAFEQGLMLKTPERVPFRLTRDIIDGMGVTGVEGVFRRCCEETLSVMRTNKEALLTIIEVFIHDPLYKWALSPLKAMQRQKDNDYELDANLEDSDEDEYEGNKDATRALLRVKQKLDGYEDGEMRSVHGQVQQLIQDAIDPDRLCQMFPGWGAWM